MGGGCHALGMATSLSKAERMEIRRRLGNRAVPKPYVPPSQGGPAYLIAHACFDCRASWKRKLREGTAPPCPQCGNPLHEMGRSFKTPRKSDKQEWEKVRVLWSAGFRFWSYRRHPEAEPLPERLQDVHDFIRRNPDHPMRFVR